MSLSPGSPESLITTHNRITIDSNTSFYIPHSFKEIPIKNIGMQLEKFGTELNRSIPPRSKPKIMEGLSEEARFRHVEEVEKAITIPEKFRPTMIPESEKAKINLQAIEAAENDRPITIDIGPNSTHTRVDGSNALLIDLWQEHTNHYLENLSRTTHTIIANYVVDPVGEEWLYNNKASKRSNNHHPHTVFTHTLNLDELSTSLAKAWEEVTPKINIFMKNCNLSDWQTAKRKIHRVHTEMAFEYSQHQVGPAMAEYGSDVIRLEEDMGKIMEPFKKLGLNEITPQTILDMYNLLQETSSQTGPVIDIPFTNVKIPELTLRSVFRKIALELSYNRQYQDIHSPIRVTPTDSTIFTRGFRRVGMTTHFPGSPKVGTIPEIATPKLISSRKDRETRMFTPINKSRYPTTSNIILDRHNTRYNIPLFITDDNFISLAS